MNELRTYEKPQLKEHGELVELTLQQSKQVGPTDGFIFNGVPIQTVS